VLVVGISGKGNNGIDDSIARPLGKGFDQVEVFLGEYIREDRDEENSTPDLGLSLRHVGMIDGIDEILSTVRQQPLCLVEGCTSPTNGQALKRFLERQGKSEAEVHAIDLIDVQAVFDRFGIEMPDTNFFVGDATNLNGTYRDGSVDVVAQDFLLNCAPYTTHLPIMQEVSRILNPGGVGIICFTDHQCILGTEQITQQQAQRELGVTINPDAFCIRDLLPPERADDAGLYKAATDALTGRVLVNGSADKYTFVTEAGGNFEFFRPFSCFEDTVEKAGLRIAGMETSSGTDRNGITCVRYRTVLKKEPEARG